MTRAPLSTAQRTASGIWSWSLLPPGLAEPSQVETDRSCASGATPTIPSGPAAGPAAGLGAGARPWQSLRRGWCPRPASMVATRVPCSGLAPMLSWPSAVAGAGDVGAAGEHAVQVRVLAVHAAVDHGDLDAGALGDVPGLGDAGLGEPVFLVPPGVGVGGGAASGQRRRRRSAGKGQGHQRGGGPAAPGCCSGHSGPIGGCTSGTGARWCTGCWAGSADAQGNSVKNIVFAGRRPW